jgi:hypothetical protein
VGADGWETPLRIACVVGGAIGVLVALGPLFWRFSTAWMWRERVQISPAGLLVRSGLPFWSDRYVAAELASVRVETNPSAGRLELTLPNGSLQLAGSLSDSDRTVLVGAIRQAILEAGPGGAGDIKEWGYPLGTSLMTAVGGSFRLLINPFARPLPYLFCDVLTIAASVAMPALRSRAGGDVDLFAWYPVIFGAYLVGLWLRRFDGAYLAGLAHYRQKYHWYPVMYLLIGFFVGLAGALGFGGIVPPGATLGVFGLVIFVHVDLLRASSRKAVPAGGEQEQPQGVSLFFGLVTTLTLVPMAIIHEQASFLFFEDTAQRYFILALPMVLPVIAVVYIPIRIHYLIESPGDKSNAAWFGLTIAALAVYAVFGSPAGWSLGSDAPEAYMERNRAAAEARLGAIEEIRALVTERPRLYEPQLVTEPGMPLNFDCDPVPADGPQCDARLALVEELGSVVEAYEGDWRMGSLSALMVGAKGYLLRPVDALPSETYGLERFIGGLVALRYVVAVRTVDIVEPERVGYDRFMPGHFIAEVFVYDLQGPTYIGGFRLVGENTERLNESDGGSLDRNLIDDTERALREGLRSLLGEHLQTGERESDLPSSEIPDW